MNDALPWHDEADLLGVHVLIHFFDPQAVDDWPDAVDRQLPMLAACTAPALRPRLLAPLDEPASYRVGRLVAQPDAVLGHGDGLLCLVQQCGLRGGLRGSGRGRHLRPLDRALWREQLPTDLVLQSVAAAMAVAGDRQRVTAALWRGSNAICQFDPGPAVLELLATQIDAARRYWNEPLQVSPDQLASFCEPLLRVKPGLRLVEPA